jgi:hypothetical protein
VLLLRDRDGLGLRLVRRRAGHDLDLAGIDRQLRVPSALCQRAAVALMK